MTWVHYQLRMRRRSQNSLERRVDGWNAEKYEEPNITHERAPPVNLTAKATLANDNYLVQQSI